MTLLTFLLLIGCQNDSLFKPGVCDLSMKFVPDAKIMITITNSSSRTALVQPIYETTYYVYVKDHNGDVKYAISPSSGDNAIPNNKELSLLGPGNTLSATFAIPLKFRKMSFEYSVHYWGEDLARDLYAGLKKVKTSWMKPPKGWLGK